MDIAKILNNKNYGQDYEFARKCLDFLDKETSLVLNEDQEKFLLETFSRFNTETATHSLNCVQISDRIFKEDNNISKNDFLIGMAIHDIGKLIVDKDIIEKIGLISDKERLSIKNHTLYSIDVINEIQNSLNLKNTFSSKITDISTLHHLDADFIKRENLPDYIKLAQQIDIVEALSAKRVYKAERPIEFSKIILEKETEKHGDRKSLEVLERLEEVYEIKNKVSEFFKEEIKEVKEKIDDMKKEKSIEMGVSL